LSFLSCRFFAFLIFPRVTRETKHRARFAGSLAQGNFQCTGVFFRRFRLLSLPHLFPLGPGRSVRTWNYILLRFDPRSRRRPVDPLSVRLWPDGALISSLLGKAGNAFLFVLLSLIRVFPPATRIDPSSFGTLARTDVVISVPFSLRTLEPFPGIASHRVCGSSLQGGFAPLPRFSVFPPVRFPGPRFLLPLIQFCFNHSIFRVFEQYVRCGARELICPIPFRSFHLFFPFLYPFFGPSRRKSQVYKSPPQSAI